MDSDEIGRSRLKGLAPANLWYVLWLLFAVVLSLGAYVVDVYRSSVAASTIVYLVVTFGHLLRVSHRDEKIDWLAPDLIYIFVFSLFHYGYIIPYLLGLIPSIKEIFIFGQLMPFALFLVNFGAISFILGYELGLTKTRSDILVETPRYIGFPGLSWYRIAWAIMITALVFHFGTLVQVPLSTLLTNTYYVIMHMDEYVPNAMFFYISGQVFLLGAVIYFATSLYRTGKLFSSKFAMVTIIGFMAFTMLEGHRGAALRMLIVALCARWYYKKRMKIIWVIALVAAMFFLVGATRILRTTVGIDVTRLASEYQYQKEQARYPVWLETFVELGGTIRVVNTTVGVVEGNYWWGRTLLQSFVGTISRHITNKLGPPPSTWLTYHLSHLLKGGVGSSVIAEGYLNLGIPGVFIIMCGIGFVLRRLHVRMLVFHKPTNLILYLVALAGAVYSIRQNLELAIPLFMRTWIICGVLSLILPFNYYAVEEQDDLPVSSDYYGELQS